MCNRCEGTQIPAPPPTVDVPERYSPPVPRHLFVPYLALTLIATRPQGPGYPYPHRRAVDVLALIERELEWYDGLD